MKKYIFIIVLFFLAVSCNLDRFPLDRESLDLYLKDEAQCQSFSNKFYDDLFKDDRIWDANSDLYMEKTLPALIRGGNSRPTPSSNGGWKFEVLRAINTMIGHMDNCEDPEVRVRYTGLARFFRAYYYYRMVRNFGDVPWCDHELGSTETEELYKPRDSRDYVFEKMLEDIDFAISVLPKEKNLYRITSWTALAYKSRICLFEGTWRKYHNLSLEHPADYYLKLAADAAKTFIETSPYGIYEYADDPSISYTMLFSQMQSPMDEVILAKNYSFAAQISHKATYRSFTDGAALNVNKKFVDTYLMADGSRYTDKPGWEKDIYYDEMTGRDPRLAQSIRCPGYHRLDHDEVMTTDFSSSLTGYPYVKYCVSWTVQDDSFSDSENDLPLIRAGEVYLNYAEAMAERSDVTISQADIDLGINPLRRRAGMPDMDLAWCNANPDDNYLGSAKYGFRNVKGENRGVILEIRRERMVELAQELDLRWYDLMRWKEGKCIEQDILGQYFPGPGEYDFDGDGVNDICLYEGTAPATECRLVYEIGKNPIVLTDGNKGNVTPYKNQKHQFDESRDYLFPIPTDDLKLNTNLVQNPGWKNREGKVEGATE